MLHHTDVSMNEQNVTTTILLVSYMNSITMTITWHSSNNVTVTMINSTCIYDYINNVNMNDKNNHFDIMYMHFGTGT